MTIIQKVNDAILQPIIVLLFALAIGYFLFGLVKFILNQDNDTERGEGKTHMVFGIIGIAIMAGVYGIIGVIQSSVSAIH